MQVSMFGRRGEGHLNFSATFWSNSQNWEWKNSSNVINYPSLGLIKSQFGTVFMVNIPREGTEEVSKCHTYVRTPTSVLKRIKRSLTLAAGVIKHWSSRSIPKWVISRRKIFLQSTLYAFMYLLTLNGVLIIALDKLKMAQNPLLYTLAKRRLNSRSSKGIFSVPFYFLSSWSTPRYICHET